MADPHDGASNRAANEAAGVHAPVAHEPAGTHAETPGHREAALGPIDWPAWMAGALGVVLGLVVIVAMYASSNLYAR